LNAVVVQTRRERRRGLLGREGLAANEAMLFPRARSVHTFGMRFRVTVALLDAHLRVGEVLRLPPRRVLVPRPGVRHVLECHIDLDVRPGDRLRLERARTGGGAGR
jgi:uncharacterized membrane protein (UPF0127 family)